MIFHKQMDDDIDAKHQEKGIMTSTRFLVLLGQFSGLIPINGVSKNDPNYLTFTWKSFTMLNSIISIICVVFILIIGTIHLIIFGFNLQRLGII